MKLFDRYLLREYLINVAFCLVGLSLMYIILDLFGYLSRFLEAKTPLLTIAFYYLLWLLPFLEYVFPAALLFATLYTLWRLARNNELTAMRANGLSFFRIMFPFLGVGLFFVLATAAIREFAVPNSGEWVERFRKARFNKVLSPPPRFVRAYYRNLRTRRSWDIERVDPEAPNFLLGVTITEDRANGSKLREILAQRAEYLDGRWWLYGARIQNFHDSEYLARDGTPVSYPAAGVEMPFLESRPKDIVSDLKPWATMSTLDMAHYLNAHPDLPAPARAQKKTDFHARLAMPWACLVVTLFGIPSGARNQRQNLLIGVFLAIVCFFGFFSGIQIGIFLGRKQIIWPWLGAWLSNIIFLATGLIMARNLR